MSRNFELMKQLEVEVDAAEPLMPAAPHHVILKRVAPAEGSDLFEEEILRLVQAIFLPANGRASRHVVFCGVDGESGSSSVCASTARALVSNVARPVCLVDANVRLPRLSSVLGIDALVPFSGKSTSIREQCVKIGDNLWFAGTYLMSDDRGSLLALDGLKQRLAQLQGAFEYLLVDAPGTLVGGDAALLGQLADAAVLVVEANKTRKLPARKAKETLDAAGVQVLGTVLNNRTFAIPEAIYRRL